MSSSLQQIGTKSSIQITDLQTEGYLMRDCCGVTDVTDNMNNASSIFNMQTVLEDQMTSGTAEECGR